MIGIAAVASIRARDGAKFDHFGTNSHVNEYDVSRDACTNLLSDLFTPDELSDMEHFFEHGSAGISPMKSVEVFWKTLIKSKGEYKKEALQRAYLKAEAKYRRRTAA